MELLLFLILFNGLHNEAIGEITIDSSKFKTGLVKGLNSLGLESGDLLFCQSKTFNGKMTQLGTLAPYTHSAMILKDEAGELWLLHATDNDYDGSRMKVLNEEKSRNGVIITRLEDLFNSSDGGETGYYKAIWLLKKKKELLAVPDLNLLYSFYAQHKHLPFETSKFRFILTAMDLRIRGKDLLSVRDTESIMCSEMLYMLFDFVEIDLGGRQNVNEYTPEDVFHLATPLYHKAIEFRFKEGIYIQESN